MRASWVLLRKGSRMASSKWTQSQAQALRPKSKASTQARKLPSYSLWGHGPEGPSGFQSPGPSKKKNPRWKLAPPAGKETNTAGNRSKQVQAIPGEVTRTLYAPKEPSLRFGKSPRKELAPARRAGILSSPLSAERPSVPDGPLLQMVYEDKHYCFVSKPAGHSLAPGGMFMSQVHAHSISNRWERNKTVFQLCPGASGLVVLAKSNYGVLVRKRMRKVALRKSAHKKNVERTYLRTEFLAMVMGTPREEYGVIRGVVTKHENHYIVQPVQNGADVVLRYSVLGSNPHKTLGELSALSIVLVKGHTDHVRALLQQVLGTPIIGDTQYGGASMSWVEPYVRHDEEEEGKWGRLPDSRPPEGLPALLIPTRLNTLQLAAGGERTDIQPISGFATDLVNADVQEAASHLDIFQRFKASKYGENDDDYFVEFPAEEKENFPAEVCVGEVFSKFASMTLRSFPCGNWPLFNTILYNIFYRWNISNC